MTDATTVLVAVDGSPGAVHALRWAADRAGAAGAHLRVMTSWEPAALLGLPAGGIAAPSEDELLALGDRLLDEALEAIDTTLPAGVSRVVRHGRPAAAILDEIAAEAPDLVVVGTHGHATLARVLLGSVSTQLAAHAPCPVVVVPEKTEVGRVGRVRVGFDGSAGARAAVDWVVNHTACPVEVVHAWSLPTVFRPLSLGSDDVEKAAVDALAEMVDGLPSAARSRVTVRLVEGDPRHVLLDGLDEHSALVVGRRATGPLASLLGSVSTHAASHAAIPVVIVPPAPE